MTEYGLLYEAYLRGACAGRVCGGRAVGVRCAYGGCAVGVCGGRAACAVQQEQCLRSVRSVVRHVRRLQHPRPLPSWYWSNFSASFILSYRMFLCTKVGPISRFTFGYT